MVDKDGRQTLKEPTYRKLIRIHDRIWESDWPSEVRVAACQMMANVFGEWKKIEWMDESLLLQDT